MSEKQIIKDKLRDILQLTLSIPPLLWKYDRKMFWVLLMFTLIFAILLFSGCAKQYGDEWKVKGANPETNKRMDDFWLTRSNFIGSYSGQRLDQ